MPDLPVGYQRFSRNDFFNYQLNRWYSLGFMRHPDLVRAGRAIQTFEHGRRVLTDLAATAERESRLRHAAFCYRAAEFFTDPEAPGKLSLYRRFRETFDTAFADEGFDRHLVAYGTGHLSVIRMGPAGSAARGTVVIHAGFDSLIEEFFCFWKHFAEQGYQVIAFDGPGQGATLRLHGVTHDHDWEKPVGTVLDHFALSEVTLLGISFGGHWCLRAAAHDRRIACVIVDPPLFDLMAGRARLTRAIVDRMLRSPGLLNRSLRLRMRVSPTVRHLVRTALHITDRLDAEPEAAVRWLLGMNRDHVDGAAVDQDVLLLAGAEDRFQPPAQLALQKAALTGARSVTARVFTRAEQGQHHCQMGNLPLALTTMSAWLDRLDRRPAAY